MLKLVSVTLALLVAPLLFAAEGGTAAISAEADKPVQWEKWHAGNDVSDLASLQRGARNFMNYCIGCHSLKYLRYQRMADDLRIPTKMLGSLITTGDAPLDYINSNMPPADAEVWFGKTPPDLSLMARSRSPDYLYRFLKTFYLDPTRPTGTNNLALPSAAMPAVLSALEGTKEAVYRDVPVNIDGKSTTEKQFDHFQTGAPGTMTPAQFDAFVRDTVNFLDYAGEPAQIVRHAEAIWVVLFLILFTVLAWMLKLEYWKKVH